jgi:hypothetical protein
MLVPRHWAEHRTQHRVGRGPQVTIRRWGWSDESADAAAAKARERAEAALAEHLAGKRIGRREGMPGYNGADGVPIREEILAEHPECGAVITRNAYGARCLNVEDVLFADVDDPGPLDMDAFGCGVWAAAVLAVVIAMIAGSWIPLAAGAGVMAGLVLWSFRRRALRRRLITDHHRITERATTWCGEHPSWRLRIYRTPAGYRLLATHATMAPTDPAIAAFFKRVSVDPVYARMCRKQGCFRARLTGKPWRMGVTLRPPRGRWPHRTPEAQDRRARFAAACDAAAPGFAACRFVAEVGTAPEHPRCAAVRDLHDRESRALSDLPLA